MAALVFVGAVLPAEYGADPLFVQEAHYVASSGSYGADGTTESTTALMAVVGMGGPRGMRAFVGPDRVGMEALSLEAVKLAVDLGVDVNAVNLDGQKAADASRYASVVEFLRAAGAH